MLECDWVIIFLYYDNAAILFVLFRVKTAKEHLFINIGKVRKERSREPIMIEGIITINL